MPRSTTPADGRDARNQDRITRLIRIRIGEEIDSLTSQILHYRRVAKQFKHSAIDGEIEYLQHMIAACRRLQTRFVPNTKRHVPQEFRGGDGSDS